MTDLLGDDGTKGTVGAELGKITTALTGGGGIKELVNTVATGQTAANLDIKAKFDDLKAAVEKANKAIDEKLESGDLTQLDTSNLKALRSSINDIQSQIQTAFEDANLKFDGPNNNVEPAKAKELLAALEGGAIKSNTELGEKAKGVVTSSQNQAETVAEMRDQLQAFAANPKGSELESANFTGYLETVDAALSNISDQRTKLGASQNETATSSKTAMDKALGDGKTDGIIKKLTDENADGLAKALKTVIGKFNGNGQKVTITENEYNAVKTGISDITTAIDDALETGGLTQLDTANLKAIKSSVVDLEKAFTSIDGVTKNGNDYEVEAKDSAKVKESIDNILKASKEEVGASATKALESSKAQAENIGEMRTQLQAFAANPKGADLASANFTSYLETVDAALSNISDQRAKLGASQNRLEYTIKTIMLGVF